MLVVAVLLVIAAAIDCPLADVGTVSPACLNSDSQAPYCVATNTSGQTGANCQQCRTLCDCALDQYCSSAPGKRGVCVPYPGGYCVAMSDSELLNPLIPSSYKCAALYTDPSTGNLAISWKGFCQEYTCFPCNPGPTPASALQQSLPCSGNGPLRLCIQPGYYASSYYVAWSPSVFFNNASALWLAIIWTTLALLGGAYLFFACSRRNAKRR